MLERVCNPPMAGLICCDAHADLPVLEQDQWLRIATEMVNGRLDTAYGWCSYYVRPCTGRNCACLTGGSPFEIPILIDGGWQNISPCQLAWNDPGCDCSTNTCIYLGTQAHPGIVSVNLDGVVLLEGTDWYLRDREWLCRVGAEWPHCSDHSVAWDQPGAFAVELRTGTQDAPESVQLLISEVVCYLIKKPCKQCAGNCLANHEIQLMTESFWNLDPFNGMVEALECLPEVEIFGPRVSHVGSTSLDPIGVP